MADRTTTRLPRWTAVLLVAVTLACGVGFLLTGVQDVRHAHVLGRSGVPAVGTVLQDDGYGKYAVLVTYPGPAGPQRGVLPTPHRAGSYPVGTRVRVLYDPDEPRIVTLQSTGGSTRDGIASVAVGAVLLGVLVLAAGVTLAGRRRPRGA